VAIASTPDELMHAYVSAGVSFSIFTVVDDHPNSIEQTIKLIGANRNFFQTHSIGM